MSVDEARETVDLVALVQRVCDSLEDTGLKVEFETQGRLAYTCRPSALRRALSNLIENAARYGEDRQGRPFNEREHGRGPHR